ncbi:MAG: hypothetical protein P1U32_09120 [Legionellaceae bacterium]|nr:hypothetical protein [Legionellaceae bacterium]
MYLNEIAIDAENCLLNFVALLKECIKHHPSLHKTWFHKAGNDYVFCSDVGYPLMNGLFSHAHDDIVIQTKLQQLSEQFKDVTCPITWLWPHGKTIPSKILNIFEAYGYVPMGAYTTLASHPDCILSKPMQLKAHESIEVVQGKQMFDAFITLTQEAFSVPNEGLSSLRALYNAYNTSDKLTLFLAKSHGEYVAALASFYKKGQLGLYNAATDARHRKKGLLTHLVQQAVRMAPPCDIIFAQLMAGEHANGVCEYFDATKLGHFIPLCKGFQVETIDA